MAKGPEAPWLFAIFLSAVEISSFKKALHHAGVVDSEWSQIIGQNWGMIRLGTGNIKLLSVRLGVDNSCAVKILPD